MREKYSGSEKPHISAISFIDIWRPYISSSFFRVFDALGKKKLKGRFAVSVPKKPPNVIFGVTYFFNFFGQVKARIPQIVHKVVVERRYHAVLALTHKRHDKLQIGAVKAARHTVFLHLSVQRAAIKHFRQSLRVARVGTHYSVAGKITQYFKHVVAMQRVSG